MNERMSLLKEILINIETWDETPLHAHMLIEKAKPAFEHFSKWNAVPFTKEETIIATKIAGQQRRLIESLKAEKTAIAAEIRALNNKTALAENYLYPKNKPTFVNHHM